MYFDMPLDELKKYTPPREEPDDFDTFWQQTITQSRTHPLNARFETIDFGLKTIDTYDLTFAGYGGQPIKGWFLVPHLVEKPLACVVEYIGYGGGRGFPTDWLLWSSAGFAHLIMDARGQGSAWLHGDTPDVHINGASPHYPGFMTLGILDPKTYYYRRVFTDAVRAVEAARSHPDVKPDCIAVTGRSQGGGIALAVSALVPDVAAVMPDVPFLCHYQRAVAVTDADPYNEITRYCTAHRNKTETVFSTLSYFDGLNFAIRARAQALFSVGLMDNIVPPSTVYAAYNHYAGPKDIRVWHFNQHEGGGSHQEIENINFLTKLWR